MLHKNVKMNDGLTSTNIYILKNLSNFAFTTVVPEVLSVFYFKVNKSKYRKWEQENIQCINWVVLLNGSLFGYAHIFFE